MNRPICPACDLTDGMAPLVALAIGVGVALACPDLHAITEGMCKNHRLQWVLAMAKASEVLEAAPAPEPTGAGVALGKVVTIRGADGAAIEKIDARDGS